MRKSDGSVYKGMFKQNRFEGLGFILYKDGSFYNGTFKNDTYYGFGEF